MNEPSHFVGQIGESDLATLGLYRSKDGWEIAVDESGIYWLRIPANKDNESTFAKLPLIHRWTLQGELLFRRKHQLPDRVLPICPWKPLSEGLPFQKSTLCLPACPPAPLPLTLIHSSMEMEPLALLTESDRALRWAEQAFAPRLKPLQFSVCENSEVLFLGTPLPPIEGTAYYELGRLLIPSGWSLPDYLHHLDMEEAFALRDDERVLLRHDHSADRILREQLLPCTRANLRTSLTPSYA